MISGQALALEMFLRSAEVFARALPMRQMQAQTLRCSSTTGRSRLRLHLQQPQRRHRCMASTAATEGLEHVMADRYNPFAIEEKWQRLWKQESDRRPRQATLPSVCFQ